MASPKILLLINLLSGILTSILQEERPSQYYLILSKLLKMYGRISYNAFYFLKSFKNRLGITIIGTTITGEEISMLEIISCGITVNNINYQAPFI